MYRRPRGDNLFKLLASYVQQSLRNGPSVCLSCHSTAAVACGGFAAERRAGRRHRSTAAGAGDLQRRRRSTALSSKRKQCRVYKPNTTRLHHPESTGSCRRSAWSTFPLLCSDQSSAGAVRETVYRRRPGLPGRRTHHLERPAGQRDISPVSVNLPSAFKNISVPGLIP